MIIIKYPYYIKKDAAQKMYDKILEQKANGVILVDNCCEVIVTEDENVKVMFPELDELKESEG